VTDCIASCALIPLAEQGQRILLYTGLHSLEQWMKWDGFDKVAANLHATRVVYNLRADGFEAIRAAGEVWAFNNAFLGQRPAHKSTPSGQFFGIVYAGVDGMVHA